MFRVSSHVLRANAATYFIIIIILIGKPCACVLPYYFYFYFYFYSKALCARAAIFILFLFYSTVFFMYLSEKCDNKIEDKHTARHRAPRTRPHVTPCSLLHRQYAAKLPLCRHLCLDEEHRPYSAHHLQTRHDDRALHRAYNGHDLRVVGRRVP